MRYFFAGFGTCGTLTGVGRFLKEQDPSIQIVAVEPRRGHRLPGLKNFEEAKEPTILDRNVINEVIRVDDEPAYAMTQRLFREEALEVPEIVTTDPAAEADFRALARRKRHELLSVEEAVRKGGSPLTVGRRAHSSTVRPSSLRTAASRLVRPAARPMSSASCAS